jgi:hypothetical protein
LVQDVVPRYENKSDLNLPFFALGERAEKATLILIKGYGAKCIASGRNNQIAAVYFNANPRGVIAGGLSIRERQPGKELPVRPETIIQLSIQAIRQGIAAPQTPIGELPFPLAIPKNLPGMPPENVPPAQLQGAQALGAQVAAQAPGVQAGNVAQAPAGPPPGRLTLIGRSIVQFVQRHETPISLSAATAIFIGLAAKGLPVFLASTGEFGGITIGPMMMVAAAIATISTALFSFWLLINSETAKAMASVVSIYATCITGWMLIGGVTFYQGLISTQAIFSAAVLSAGLVYLTKYSVTRLYERLRV